MAQKSLHKFQQKKRCFIKFLILFFFHFSEFEVLVVHRNVSAGGHARLCSYLNEVISRPVINLEPVLSLSGLKNFEAASEVSLAQIRLAIPKNNQVFNTGNAAVYDVLKLGQQFQG